MHSPFGTRRAFSTFAVGNSVHKRWICSVRLRSDSGFLDCLYTEHCMRLGQQLMTRQGLGISQASERPVPYTFLGLSMRVIAHESQRLCCCSRVYWKPTGRSSMYFVKASATRPTNHGQRSA